MPEREQGAAPSLHRLAEVAHERGLRLFRDPSGRWLCTSASDERLVHYVTALSCDCPGFIRHQRCSHLALLLETLGWLPARDGGVMKDLSPVRCIACTGGQIEEWTAGHVSGSRSCDVCHGTRAVPLIAA